MTTDTVTTIDITPTWEGLLPLLLRVHEHGTTQRARSDAFDELARMAKLADYCKQLRDDVATLRAQLTEAGISPDA